MYVIYKIRNVPFTLLSPWLAGLNMRQHHNFDPILIASHSFVRQIVHLYTIMYM